MELQLAQRMHSTPRSFIRDILKVTENPAVISFAGGLPNPKFFPVAELAAAAEKVMRQAGSEVLQYSTSEGYRPLREYIAARHLDKHGLRVDPDQILITAGSQQGLDLLGKVFLDPGDGVILERPGYLGAIQAFSLYRPRFHPVSLRDDGVDLAELETVLQQETVKFFYAVPNFQNPAGVSYTLSKRRQVAALLQHYQVPLIEDDPYGALRFAGSDLPLLKTLLNEQTVLLGTFSKMVAPSLRLGWICAPSDLVGPLTVAKQASDLHTNYLAQRILYQYLLDNDLEQHLARIRTAYRAQRDVMVEAIETHFPPQVHHTQPEGGMFLWLTLPPQVSAQALFEIAAARNVAFVPGRAFYIDGGGDNTLRLNFSNSNQAQINSGIERLGSALKELMSRAERV